MWAVICEARAINIVENKMKKITLDKLAAIFWYLHVPKPDHHVSHAEHCSRKRNVSSTHDKTNYDEIDT